MSRITLIPTNEFDAFAGSELLWAKAAGALADDGNTVEVNIPDWHDLPTFITNLKSNIRISFESRPTSMPVLQRLVSKLGGSPVEKYFENYRKSYLARSRPDLVLISQGGLVDGVPWMEACIELEIPFVVLVHLVADSHWPDTVISDRAAFCYPMAKKVLFVSEHNRALASLQLGVNFSNSGIVRNPFNVDYHSKTTWPCKTNEWDLACVGRLGAEHKGQDLLIEVLSQAKWRDRPLTVTLYGKGHHRILLERQIQLRKPVKVRFGGYTNGIEEIWRTHHALVMPSRYEGLPIALVEAMLCNRMAIVTDVGGNRELVTEGITGFIAETPTVASLDAALERSWQRREEWLAMGLNAGSFVRKIIPEEPVEEFKSLLLDAF